MPLTDARGSPAARIRSDDPLGQHNRRCGSVGRGAQHSVYRDRRQNGTAQGVPAHLACHHSTLPRPTTSRGASRPAILAVPFVLVVQQPDLGTALVLVPFAIEILVGIDVRWCLMGCIQFPWITAPSQKGSGRGRGNQELRRQA
jgi:hypothetical protein